MRRLSLTVLAAGAVLVGAAPHAHAQFFNYLTDFETPSGTTVVNAFSTDQTSALGINDIAINPVFVGTASTPVALYQFATNSQFTNNGQGTNGVFNFPYQVKVTITPANAAGQPLAGYAPVTQYITGTITGQLTQNTNTLVNTYNNLVSTPDGQAQVLNYVFSAAGMPTITLQFRALASQFNNGGSPVPKLGSAGATLVSTPEPGALAMLFGMGFTGLAVARRMRRK